jgi:hypothetical protein
MGYAPTTILALSDLGEALVGFERIPAGRDEVEDGVEVGARKPRIGRGASHLGVQLVAEEWLTTRRTQQVLRKHIECAGTR